MNGPVAQNILQMPDYHTKVNVKNVHILNHSEYQVN